MRNLENVYRQDDRRRIKTAASFSVQAPDRAGLQALVGHLMSCDAHLGGHHFVVHGDTRTLYGSFSAQRCLKAGGWL
jgi:hypothetical protein